MQITADRKALFKTLGSFLGVVGKDPNPILAHVLLEAKGNSLKITGTDRSLTLRETLSIEVEEEGNLLVNPRDLASVLKTGTTETAELEQLKNGRLQVTLGKSKFKLPTLEVANFLEVPSLPTGYLVQVPSNTLVELLEKTAFAAAREEDSRYFIKGALLKIQDDLMQVAVTDGNRLAIGSSKLEEEALESLEVLLPSYCLGEVKKTLHKAETTEIAVENSHIHIQCGDRVLSANRSTGKFPAYGKVLANSSNICDQSVILDAANLKQLFEAVSLTAEGDSDTIKVTIDGSTLSASLNTATKGESYSEMDIAYNGSKIEMGLNAKHCQEWAHTVEADQVEFSFKDATSGIKIDHSSELAEYTYIANQTRI